MSDLEHIFVRTGRPVAQAAELLGSLAGTTLTLLSTGGFSLSRARTDGPGTVHATVEPNEYVSVGEDTILAGYETVLGVGTTVVDEEVQRAEAERLFSDIVENLRWPALLVFGFGRLVAGWSPEHGTRRFPEGTSPDATHRAVWARYELPAVVPPPPA